MWFIVPGTELVVQDRHISTEIVRYVSVHLLCYMLAEQGSLTTRCISYPSLLLVDVHVTLKWDIMHA